MEPNLKVDFAGLYVPVTQGKIDVALSNLAKGYSNNELVAPLLAPFLEVENQSDKYWVWGRDGQRIDNNQDLRAPAAAAERIVQGLSTDNYQCVDHALARLIPDEERANFQAGDVEQWATDTIMEKLRLMHELRVATLATTNANYDASCQTTLAGASQWSDYAGSDPAVAVETSKQALRKNGIKPNLMLLGDDVFTKLRRHTKIRAEFQYSDKATRPLTEADLAAYFGVEQVVVASAVVVDKNNAPSFVWGKHAILAQTRPQSAMKDQSFAKTFVWRGAPNTVGGFGTEIGRISPPSARADEVAVHWYYGLKIVSNISAYLFKNAVA